MEVSNIHPPVSFTHTSDPNYNVDMDIDMDIDLGGDAEIAALEAEAMRIVRPSSSLPTTNNPMSDIC